MLYVRSAVRTGMLICWHLFYVPVACYAMQHFVCVQLQRNGNFSLTATVCATISATLVEMVVDTCTSWSDLPDFSCVCLRTSEGLDTRLSFVTFVTVLRAVVVQTTMTTGTVVSYVTTVPVAYIVCCNRMDKWLLIQKGCTYTVCTMYTPTQGINILLVLATPSNCRTT